MLHQSQSPERYLMSLKMKERTPDYTKGVWVECPVCKLKVMPKGNYFCSLKCYNENERPYDRNLIY